MLPSVIPELNAPAVDARNAAEEVLSRFVEEDVFVVSIVGLNLDVDNVALEMYLKALLGEQKDRIKQVQVHFDEETGCSLSAVDRASYGCMCGVGDSYGRATVSFTSKASVSVARVSKDADLLRQAARVRNMLHNKCPEEIGMHGTLLQVKPIRK
eukprot:767776-Hanusia_phi.AAC.2